MVIKLNSAYSLGIIVFLSLENKLLVDLVSRLPCEYELLTYSLNLCMMIMVSE